MLRNLVAARVARVMGCLGEVGLLEAMNICAAQVPAACSGDNGQPGYGKASSSKRSLPAAQLWLMVEGDRLNKRAILNEALGMTDSKGGMLLQR